MGKKNELLDQVKDIVRQTNERDIRFVGFKPWYDRPLSKFKFGLLVGIAAGVVSGLSAFAAFHHDSSKNVSPNDQMPKVSNVAEGKITVQPEAPHAPVLQTKRTFASTLDKFRAEHPNLDFSKIKNAREVSKNFLGKNNFIALAAEMEGFRGDLHKDPATGLNIGFGYNITKRAELSKEEVTQDLQSIGVNDKQIARIIEISLSKQKDLNKKIKQFNEDFKLPNNQLITLEQGVALLKRTEKEYRAQARETFVESFDKMEKHQQQVLTYAAYKAGYEALSKYKKAIKAANVIYTKHKQPNTPELKSIAKELTFYYSKDGREMVLDERATLIAQTFVSQDYLGLQIGKTDILKQSPQKLYQQKIDFSHLDLSLTHEKKHEKPDISHVLEKLRKQDTKHEHKLKHN
jgi:hypothetical protein